MKGNEKVIEALNEILTNELTAINQYFVHAEICENLGYGFLYKMIRMESIDEMKHAEKLIERILYLDGQPNMSRYRQVEVGAEVEEMFQNDLKLERHAIAALDGGIKTCFEAGDHGSRDLLEQILRDEERHHDWIETQLGLIGRLGLVQYLSRQVEAGE